MRPGERAVPAPHAAAAVGRYRWVICALLFAASTINYIDRQVLGILAPDLQRSIGWNEIEYGYIVTSFQAAYALGLLLVGRMMDRLGSRVGYTVAITIWSVAAMAHALARTAFGFGVARFGLGLGEAGNFPVAIKTVAEWFPRRERALATGLFNSGTNVGAIIAPLIVPPIALAYGWQWAFILTGAIGFGWIVFWLALYDTPERHPKVSAAELALIQGDGEEAQTSIPWGELLRHRQTWAFTLGKFLTDPIWWFYLYWMPKFLHDVHGLTLSGIGPPLVVIYLVSDAGSITGGWLSSSLIKRGWAVNPARKTAMLVCALAVTPIVFASRVSNLWGAVALVSLAAAAHQGWSANMFTLASDMFPRRAVASVVGFGGMGGAIGGMLIATVTGYILQFTGSYLAVFMLAGSTYLVALLGVHLLAPSLAPADLRTPRA
ncbi:MAG: MFS transporter [Acidobacteria bacterium]|nr:MFS transporter [Acidobacteriota bacterium]